MDNEAFLNELKKVYQNARYFQLEDNKLILNYNGTFKMNLNNVSLSRLNPNLFLVHPKEIINILYLLELLYKYNLEEKDIMFIDKYVNRYLKLNDNHLDNNEENDDIINGLNIPIYMAYDPYFIEKPASMEIMKIIDNHTEELSSGKNNQKRLVLTKGENPNFEEEEEINKIEEFEKAGFTALFLIVGTVIATVFFLISTLN